MLRRETRLHFLAGVSCQWNGHPRNSPRRVPRTDDPAGRCRDWDNGTEGEHPAGTPPARGMSFCRTLARGRNRDFEPGHGCNETVPLAGQRFDASGFLSRIAQRSPELIHGGIQTMFEIDESSLGPGLLAQLLARRSIAIRDCTIKSTIGRSCWPFLVRNSASLRSFVLPRLSRVW